MVKLGEVSPAVCETTVSEIELALGNDDFEAEYDEFNWRKTANRRKFDRELFEKYGYLKDLILHPKFQHVKHYLEEHADFNIFLGDPLIPVATAVIILFMINKRVSRNLVGLTALLIFNVNPLYVCLAACATCFMTTSKRPPRQYKRLPKHPADSHNSNAKTNNSAAVPLTADMLNSGTTSYDHLLIGSDISTLYTAALLAKNGHRCCVLQPAALGPMHEIHPEGAPCPAPITNASIGRIERYQALLDVVQHSNGSERVTFAPVGTEADGYTSAILRTTAAATGLGGVGGLRSAAAARKSGGGALSCLRVGESSLPFDFSAQFPLEKSLLVAGLQRMYAALPFLTSFLISRAMPAAVWSAAPLASVEGAKLFRYLCGTSAESVVHAMSLESSPAAIAALHGIAAAGADESLCAADCSGYTLANALQSAAQGVFYPAGGARAIAAALVQTITQAGGVVYCDAEVREVVLEEVPGAKAVKTTGVTVAVPSARSSPTTVPTSPIDALEAKSDENSPNSSDVTFHAERSVISGLGVISTFTKVIPAEAISAATRQMLAGLREVRPVVKVVYWLRGDDATALGLSSTDYYEVGAQPRMRRAKSPDSPTADSSTAAATSAGVETSPSTADEEELSQIQEENDRARDKFAGECALVWSPSCKDSTWAARHGGDLHVVVVELPLTSPYVELKEVSFGADISSSASETPASGAFVFVSTHRSDTASDPAHPDFEAALAVPLTLSKSKQDAFQRRADQVLDSLYPGARAGAVHTHVLLPVLGGGSVVSNTTEKFGAPLSAITDIQNLYLTGRDLGTSGLAGDLQGGWVAANAVLGYTLAEMVASRNIVSDLGNLR